MVQLREEIATILDQPQAPATALARMWQVLARRDAAIEAGTGQPPPDGLDRRIGAVLDRRSLGDLDDSAAVAEITQLVRAG